MTAPLVPKISSLKTILLTITATSGVAPTIAAKGKMDSEAGIMVVVLSARRCLLSSREENWLKR